MSTTRLLANLVSPRALKSKPHDYYTLTKPEVNLLVPMTTWAGYYLGSRGPTDDTQVPQNHSKSR
jgi:heme O synthase-like polyprenyltransferase